LESKLFTVSGFEIVIFSVAPTAKVRECVELYLHSLIRLYNVVHSDNLFNFYLSAEILVRLTTAVCVTGLFYEQYKETAYFFSNSKTAIPGWGFTHPVTEAFYRNVYFHTVARKCYLKLKFSTQMLHHSYVEARLINSVYIAKKSHHISVSFVE
jgi:hypothetical protein